MLGAYLNLLEILPGERNQTL